MAASRTPKRTHSTRPKVRDATVSDAKQVATLVTALGYPTNASDMKVRLEGVLGDPTYHTFVAELDGQIVGMAGACVARFYEKNGSYARLVALVVSDSSSGRGVGAALVRAVEDWSTAKGANEIFLNSGLQREGAHAFYGKLGYRETGVRFSKELG